MCENSFKSGEENLRAGHLRAARASFIECARTSCGGRLSRSCNAKLAQLESEMPSVVPAATGEDGVPRVDVLVAVDGEVVTTHLDGQAFAIDPGLHELSFARGGEVFAKQKVFVIQGQRNRPITISVPPLANEAQTKAVTAPAPPPPEDVPPPQPPPPKETVALTTTPPPSDAPPEPPQSAGHSAWPFAIGAVGLVGIGTGALLTYWGRKDNDALSACSPACPASSVTHIKTLYVAADISFVAGGAALAASALTFFLERTKEGSRWSVAMGVQPTRSGGVASLSGAF
jgi:hypothetical protein